MNKRIKTKEKVGQKHILVAKTLSEAAEITENMEETNRELNEMMEKLCRCKELQRLSKKSNQRR
ncbi:MAG: hypothetical protein KGY76_07945 [Candidatus Thermoplasmatota archaeon]|nr:hypothetical protein [Candidatus Thermoplasmatota archaeon]